MLSSKPYLVPLTPWGASLRNGIRWFHLCLPCVKAWVSKPFADHSSILSAHRFLCLPLILLSLYSTWMMVLARQLDRVTWSFHLSFIFLTVVWRSSNEPVYRRSYCILGRWWCVRCMRCPVFYGRISPQNLYSHLKFDVRFHVSHAYILNSMVTFFFHPDRF